MKRGPTTMTSALVLIVLAATAALAQPPAPPPPSPPPPVISPEVQPDRRVTFRLRAPNAREVVVERQGVKLALEKDEQGLWTVTTGPPEPDIYGYSFPGDAATHVG